MRNLAAMVNEQASQFAEGERATAAQQRRCPRNRE